MNRSSKINGTTGKPLGLPAAFAGCLLTLWLITGSAARGAEEAAPPGAIAGKEGLLVSNGLENGRIRLLSGKSAVLTTNRPYKRLSIADPEVADARPVGITSILLTPKKAGQTQLILWDDNERSQMIDVGVVADTAQLSDQLKALFPGSQIEVSSANGTLVLRGRVGSTQAAEQAVAVAGPYASKVLNMLEVSGGQQVMLQVKFAEVSRSASSSLGVNFGFTDGHTIFGNNIGQVSPLGITDLGKGAAALAVPTPTAAVTLFGRGEAGRVAFDYFVEALRQNDLLRILAEPNLLAMSGQEASFLAGGEFPVPVTGGGTVGGQPSVTVEFREFGVRLSFLPVVLGNGRIRLKVAPEVSDVDNTNSLRFSGFVIPGLTSRKISTTIELGEGQTFAIAGLLNHNVTSSKDVTPVLGDLPVLGALFRSVRYQRKETELVVLVTPRLVEGMNAEQVPPAPGENWRHPNEAELFLNQDLGGPAKSSPRPTTMPASHSAAAPPFYGQYGFVPVK